MGGCAVAAARIVGAYPVAAVDLTAEKLDVARKLGATHTVGAVGLDARAVMDELGSEVPVDGFDYVFDCVSTETTLSMAVDLVRRGIPGVRRGGTVVVVGVPSAPVELDARKIQLEEKRIVGSYGGSARPATDLPRYLRWYGDGLLDLDTLVSRRYALADVAAATTDLATGLVIGRSVLVP